MSFVGIMSLFQFNLNSFYIIEFFVKSLKDGLKCGFDPSLRIFFIKSLLAVYMFDKVFAIFSLLARKNLRKK